jgi:phage terminase small subunit
LLLDIAEGRRKKEEGRRKKEEGRRKKVNAVTAIFSSSLECPNHLDDCYKCRGDTFGRQFMPKTC